MRKTLLVTLIGSCLLIAALAPRSAVAQTVTKQALPAPPAAFPTPATPAKPHSAPGREWYGTPIVVTDIAAISRLLLASQGDKMEVSAGLALGGAGAYVLGGPTVHFTEGRTAAGFGSLGLRVGATLVGGVLGAAIPLGWAMVIGFAGGAIVASAVDYTALAYKPAKVPQLALSIPPTYRPTAGEAGVAVSGRW